MVRSQRSSKGVGTVIAVIFEVSIPNGRRHHYLELAAQLKAELEEVPGFVGVERFESLSEPGKMLSLSFWHDEDAVRTWRNQAIHRAAQAKGRAGIFESYRIRVAEVIRDYSLTERAQVPDDSQAVHD